VSRKLPAFSRNSEIVFGESNDCEYICILDHTNKLMMLNVNSMSSISMLRLAMMNDSDFASNFKATIRILFVLG